MWRAVAVVVCCAGGVAPTGQAWGQERLQLRPPPIPAAFYNDQVGRVEREMGDITAELSQSPRSRELVLEAQRKLREVVRQLWEKSRTGDFASALYAMTVENAAGDFDEMTNRLADEATAMLSPPPEVVVDADRLAELVRAGEALEEFNRLSTAEAIASDPDADAYVRRVLEPLTTVAEVMGEQPTPIPTAVEREPMQVETEQEEQMTPLQRVMTLSQSLVWSDAVVGVNLRELAAVADARMSLESTRANGEQLMRYVQELLDASVARRTAARVELPLDLRRVRRRIEANFDEAEARLYAELPQLTARPEEVTQPRWLQPVVQMQSMLRLMMHLDRVPDWIDRMSRFNPQTSRGLYQQLRRIAEDLADPALGAGAAVALAEMQNQLALFEQMPMETALSQRHPWAERITGNRSLAIMQQVTILRSQWAAAWATGADPTTAGNKLLLIRRVLVNMNEAQAEDFAQRMARLNRWSAWEVSPEALEPLMVDLPGRIEQASELIVGGKWEELSVLLEWMDRPVRMVRLASQLSRRLDGMLSQQPDGVAGMLSQCLPPEGNSVVDQRRALAELCAYLAAAEHARQRGDTGSRETMLEYASQLSATITAGMEAGE